MRVIRMMCFFFQIFEDIFIVFDQEKHPEWRVANVGASRSCRACWPTAASLVAVKRARDPKNSWRPQDSWIYNLEIVKIQWKLFEALVICGFLERSMTNSKQEVALLQTIPDHPRPSTQMQIGFCFSVTDFWHFSGRQWQLALHLLEMMSRYRAALKKLWDVEISWNVDQWQNNFSSHT